MGIRQITLGLLGAAVLFGVACGAGTENNVVDHKAPCRYTPVRPVNPPDPEVPTPKSALAALARAMAAMDLEAIGLCYTLDRWKIERVTREKDMARLKGLGVTSIVLTYEEADLKEVRGGEFVSVWAKLKFITDSGPLTHESGDGWIEEEQFIMKKEFGVWKFTK